MYRPDIQDVVFEQDGIRYLNCYLPGSVTVSDPAWQGKEGWRICDGHIRNILPDDADTVIRWMAHNVQYPGVKIAWAPVIVGAQGDGKTTIAVQMMQAAMGKSHVQTVSLEAMFSDFTGWAEGACVKVLDEIRVHGTARATAMDKLKPLITNDSVEIVRKGRDGRQIVNVTNYIATTNHMDALAVDEGDRRWAIFRTRFDSNDDVRREISPEYWERLYVAIRSEPGVLRGWLMSIDLTGINRNAAPQTSLAKRMMIEAARPSSEVEVREALAICGEGVTADVLSTECLNEIIRRISGRPLPTTTLSKTLERCGWTKLAGTMKWNGKNHRVYYRASEVDAGQTDDKIRADLRKKLASSIPDEGGYPRN
jgi:hypothetical protein